MEGEIGLHKLCLEQNSLNGYCQVSSGLTAMALYDAQNFSRGFPRNEHLIPTGVFSHRPIMFSVTQVNMSLSQLESMHESRLDCYATIFSSQTDSYLCIKLSTRTRSNAPTNRMSFLHV